MSGLARSLTLPWETARLLWRFWPVLLVWFCAGFIAHDLLLQGAARASDFHPLAGLAVVAVTVLATLAATIGMFHAVRTGLPALRRSIGTPAEAEPEPPVGPVSWPTSPPSEPDTNSEGASDGALHAVADEEARLVDVVSYVILPFVVFYGAWNLFRDDLIQHSINELQRFNPFEGEEARGFFDLTIGPLLAASAAAWVLRALCERRFRAGSRIFGILAALFEAQWMLYGFLAIGDVVSRITDWVTSRVVWVETGDAITSFLEELPGPLGGAWDGWTGFLDLVSWKDELVEPLLWLVIAALVFGRDMERQRDLVAGSRVAERVGRRLTAVSARARRFASTMSGEIREKYVPLLNGLRLVLRAGALWFLGFCVLWALVEVAHGWAERGIVQLLGPRDTDWRDVLDVPIDFAVDALFGPFGIVRIALLAVAVNSVLALVVERGASPPPITEEHAPSALEPQVAG